MNFNHKTNIYLHFIFGQFLVLDFADRSENCSSIRLSMNSDSNRTTRLRLHFDVLYFLM